MLIHIIPGDKFEHYAAEQFETVLPGGNRFVAVLPEGANASDPGVVGEFGCERVVVGTDAYRGLLDEVSRCGCVVFHGMRPRFVELVERCPSACTVAWGLWGLEVYTAIPRLFRQTLQPLTASLYTRTLIERKGVLRISKHCLGPFFPSRLLVLLVRWYKSLRRRRYRAALRRFDYILHFIDEEVQLVHETGLSEARHLHFRYGSLEKTVGERFLHVRAEGGNILLGNSASLSNNHLDAIEILAEFDLTGRRVVCPLAYGDELCGKAVVEAGKRRLGGNFTPLLEFMPIDEYNEILRKCAVVVMNHNRQQAMGNISTALWLGAKVYLNEGTTVWRYLRRIGIKAYSIPGALRPDNPSALDPPPQEDVERNRQVLLREFSYDRALDNCRGVVAEILGMSSG